LDAAGAKIVALSVSWQARLARGGVRNH
jgi:hypothetical protein